MDQLVKMYSIERNKNRYLNPNQLLPSTLIFIFSSGNFMFAVESKWEFNYTQKKTIPYQLRVYRPEKSTIKMNACSVHFQSF